MTSTQTETPPEEPAEDAPAAAEDVVAPPALEAGDGGGVSFWQRPNVERYLVPLVMPIAVVVTVVAMALNISRIFLSGHGHISVVIGSLITVSILAGATMLSAAPRMRTSSIALITGAGVMAIVAGGWLSLGHAELEEEGGEALPAEGPSNYQLEFTNSGLAFVPDADEGETGIAAITFTGGGGEHTFLFDETATQFAGLGVQATGDSETARAFFGEAGEYTFYCSIPGHREAGMEGTITISGDPKTLEAVQAELGDTGEEGGGPAEETG